MRDKRLGKVINAWIVAAALTASITSVSAAFYDGDALPEETEVEAVCESDVDCNTEGKCGDDLSWRVEGRNLIISGTGPMYDYDPSGENGTVSPFCKKRFDSVIVEEGCTRIGSYAFYDTEIFSLELSEGIRSIGECAFCCEEGLEAIVLPKGIETIEDYAFAECADTYSVVIGSGTKKIGEDALPEYISTLYLPNTLEEMGYQDGMAGYDAIYYEGSEENFRNILSDEELFNDLNVYYEASLPDFNLSNPSVLDGVTTWDCVSFGSFYQEDTNGDGIADESDEPQKVKWRVLWTTGNYAYLLSDKVLDSVDSDFSGWNNENACGRLILTDEERNALLHWAEYFMDYGMEGFVTTNSFLGFADDYGADKARSAESTSYAGGDGSYFAWVWDDNTGDEEDYLINTDGSISDYPASLVSGIRPAIRLNLMQEDCWSYAGKVDSSQSGSSESGSHSSSSSTRQDSSSSERQTSSSSSKQTASSSSTSKDSSSSSSSSSYSYARAISNTKGETMIVGEKAHLAIPGVVNSKVSAKGKAGIYTASTGTITAVQKGNIKLLAPGSNGKLQTVCTIKVEQPKLKAKLKLRPGRTKKLKLSGTKRKVDKWNSSNTSVVKVSNDGTITAIKNGSAKVSAIIAGFSFPCEVTVK